MLDRLTELLRIPDPAESDAVEQTVTLIQTALRTGTDLPPAQEVRRRLAAGVSITDTPTVEEWLTGWLAGRRNLRRNTHDSTKLTSASTSSRIWDMSAWTGYE